MTSAKEGVEDLKRHRSDDLVNNSRETVLSEDAQAPPGAEAELRRRDLKPGQVVHVRDRRTAVWYSSTGADLWRRQ